MARPRRGSYPRVVAAASSISILYSTAPTIVLLPQSPFALVVPCVDVGRGARRVSSGGCRRRRLATTTTTSSSSIPSHRGDGIASDVDDECDGDGEGEDWGHPVRVHHSGHDGTIFVRKGETILHALERQSISPPLPGGPRRRRRRRGSSSSSSRDNVVDDADDDVDDDDDDAATAIAIGSVGNLAFSHVPHDCRRGTCLTCSSRTMDGCDIRHVMSNVNDGLAETISSYLERTGIVLTCCSYVTGPGVVLELDVNDDVWDMVHRRRTYDEPDTETLGMEARARLFRRIDEGDVNGWRRRTEDALGMR
jgi:ferredoxin